jgi:predicted ATP-dependent endonuclease of OLD family
MIIKSVYIRKFRAFDNVTIELGTKVTAIAGQNGTLKSTLLGIIAQPFSVTKPPLSTVKTLDNTKFISEFGDKFKLSETYDIAGQHLFTINFYDNQSKSYHSINRNEENAKYHIRFWSTEGRKRGMGYTQCPVLFLTLKRLTPIGEEELNTNFKVQLDKEELELYCQWQELLSIVVYESI